MKLKIWLQIVISIFPLILYAQIEVPKESIIISGEYQGVTPGKETIPEHILKGLKSGERFILWQGFQKKKEGENIVFLQTNFVPTYTTKIYKKRLEITIKDAKIYLRNNKNPLITRYFDTLILSSKLKQKGKDVLLTIELKEIKKEPQFEVTNGPMGSFFLLIKF